MSYSFKHFLGLVVAISAGFVVPDAAKAQSIKDLPQLSQMLIHHYRCRLAYIPQSAEPAETYFDLDPSVGGHGGLDHTLKSGADVITASVNAQMLSIEWRQVSRLIAMSQAMIQNTPTKSFVLLVANPNEPDTQVHLGCDAVVFADLAPQLEGRLK